MTTTENDLKPIKHIGVKNLPTNDLQANRHNPRHLFDEEPLLELKASIDKDGILVPLTVYFSKKDKKYVILDGQRRWICAQRLGRKTVPVNEVAEPTLVQNIVTMFAIHNKREEWQLMPTALKLELLMSKLKETSDAALAAITGLNVTNVQRCKKLLTFQKEFQDLMLDPDPAARMKPDLFIELYAVLVDRTVSKMPWFDRDHFTRRMVDRYLQNKGLKAVTDFRLMKQYIANAAAAGEVAPITGRLEEFFNNDDLPLSHLEINEASAAQSGKGLKKSTAALIESLEQIDVEGLYGDDELWDQLAVLADLITIALAKAGRDRKPRSEKSKSADSR